MKYDTDKSVFIDDSGKEYTPDEVAGIAKQSEEYRKGLTNVTDEIKSLRKAKQEAEAERDLALKEREGNKNGDNQPVDVTKQVEEILSRKENLNAADARKQAEKKFKEINKEFHEDNDVGGLKFAAIKQKLTRWNVEGIKSEDEMLEAFNDAYDLVKRKSDVKEVPFNGGGFTAQGNGATFKDANNSGLTSAETKLIETMGWTKERYLKIKSSRPAYVASLFRQV